MKRENQTPPSAPITHETQHPTKGVDFHHRAAAHVKIVDYEKALVETHPRRTKVAIVGFAMSSTMAAPFESEEHEIWGMNQLYRHIPRADRWFEIHHNWDEHVVEGTDHAGWLKSFPGPIYNCTRIPGIPNSLAFPRAECAAIGKDYFTSSVAFMIALAIRDGFEQIELYGIDLVVGEEYEYQKPCAEFWMGIASGMGRFVGTHVSSALLKQSYCYGYESEPKSLVTLSELQQRKGWLINERQKRIVEIANIDGALQDTEMWLEVATLRSRGSNVKYEPPKP